MADDMSAVSVGSYSDYRVLCICPTKADAEQVARKYGEGAQVEAFPVVTGNVEPVAVLKLTTTLWDDGTETNTRERAEHVWPFDSWHDVTPCSWRWVRAPIHERKGGRLEVHGTDHERVRKVYSDHRAELIAIDAVRMKKEAKGRVR